jgi:two-component system LytT family response regulator
MIVRPVRTIVIEDESPARLLLRNFLAQVEDVSLVGEFADGYSGLLGINQLKPDLVLLDVQMPKLTGLELLELVEPKPLIIFTTAYDKYAIRAFEQNAVDYLLKPFDLDRLKAAVEKAKMRLGGDMTEAYEKLGDSMHDAAMPVRRIVVKTGTKIKIIYLREINYLEAQDDYVMIYLDGEKHLKQKTMKYFEKQLPSDMFVRIHRSYIVRVDVVDQIELYQKDTFRAILKNGVKLPVSKAGYARIREVLSF